MNLAHRRSKLIVGKKDAKKRYRNIFQEMNPAHETQKWTDVEKMSAGFNQNIYYDMNLVRGSKKNNRGK